MSQTEFIKMLKEFLEFNKDLGISAANVKKILKDLKGIKWKH